VHVSLRRDMGPMALLSRAQAFIFSLRDQQSPLLRGSRVGVFPPKSEYEKYEDRR
jgi:hypothetical protein